jgi:hypothetical protein
MILETVAQILADNDCGQLRKSIFVEFMPTKHKGILLIGSTAGGQIDEELPGYYRGSFQLIVREKDHVKGKELALKAIKALSIQNQQVGEVKLNYVRARHLPVFYKRSEGGSLEWSVNFDTNYVDRSII